MKRIKHIKRGDTLIEVMFAVAIFGMVSISTISLMNRGLSSAQNNLETTMARQEIDAQAEALRFIHDAILTEPKIASGNASDTDSAVMTNNYVKLWKAITDRVYTYSDSGYLSLLSEDPDFFSRTVHNGESCNKLYQTVESSGMNKFGIPKKSFVINPRALQLLEKTNADGTPAILSDFDINKILISETNQPGAIGLTSTYPRLLYGSDALDSTMSDIYIESNTVRTRGNNTSLYKAEGIWVTAIASDTALQCYQADGSTDGEPRPDFYDFYIHTCWDSLSGDASTISTTVRLFNHEQVSLEQQGKITFANADWKTWDNYCHAASCNSVHPLNDFDNPSTIHSDTTGANCTPHNPENLCLKLTGYGKSYANEGIYLDISASDDFRIPEVAISTDDFRPHPGGYFILKIGPLLTVVTTAGSGFIDIATRSDDSGLKVRFVEDARTVQQIPDYNLYENYFTDPSVEGNKTIGTPLSDDFTVQNVKIAMEKHGTSYIAYVCDISPESSVACTTSNAVKSIEINNSQSENLQVAFWMLHNAHDCNIIYKFTADVAPMDLGGTDVENGGCLRKRQGV